MTGPGTFAIKSEPTTFEKEEKFAAIKSWERRNSPSRIMASARRFATCAVALISGTLIFGIVAPSAGNQLFMVLCPIANLLVGLIVLGWLFAGGCSAATCRLVFYSFTAPSWVYVIWAIANVDAMRRLYFPD